MITRLALAGIAAGAALIASTPASGCAVTIYPSSKAMERAEVIRQQDMWRIAGVVFVATVTTVPARPSDPWPKVRVRLHPERSLKGELPTEDFELAATGASTCGIEPLLDVFDGKNGDAFVVFVRGDDTSPDMVWNTLNVDAVTSPKLRARIETAGYVSR